MSQSSVRRPMIDSLEARALLSAAASNVVTVQFKGQAVNAIEDSYVVQTKNDQAFIKAAAQRGLGDVTSLGGGGFYSFTSDLSLSKLQSWGKTHGKVASLSPNMVATADYLPNDPYLKYQYALSNTGQVNPDPSVVLPGNTGGNQYQTGTVGADINVEKAWDITTGSPDVVVAVIDTGADVNHPDLAPNIVLPFNASDGSADVTDLVGHGTAVASTIAAAGNDGVGIAGVAYNSKVMPVKAVDSTGIFPTSLTITAVNYVIKEKNSGVNIVAANMSFGGTATLADPVYSAAIKRLAAAGIVAVVAGPEGSNLNADLTLDSSRYGIETGRVVVVTATDNQDNLPDGFGYGANSITLAAPGVQILMDSSADADPNNTDDLHANTNLPGLTGTDGRTHGFGVYDGTSFASPITAGVIALEASAYPQATPDQLVDALKRGVDKLASLDGTNNGGIRKVETGGRVNAYNALRVLQNRFAGTNTVTSGDWLGKYGSAGSFVYGGTTGAPALPFATSTLVPANAAVVPIGKARDTDARLLQTPDAAGRSTSYLYSTTTLSFDFDFSSSGGAQSTHRLTLYAASPDNAKRQQTITVTDSESGFVLESAPMSKFASGEYVSFDLTGKVTVTISGPSGVVLNGMFVDATPTVSVGSVGTDALTKSNWANVYGDLGYLIPGSANSVPSFASVATDGTTVSARATALSPQSPTSTKARLGGYLTTTGGDTLNVTVNVPDGTRREVTFYLANAAGKATATRVEQLAADGTVIASTDVSLAKSSEYVTFTTTSGSTATTFRFVSLVTGQLPVVSGIFFNSTAATAPAATTAATYESADSKTQGNWFGTYGFLDRVNASDTSDLTDSSGYFIAGGKSSLATTVSGATTTLLKVSSKQKVALLDPARITVNGRILGQLSSGGTLTASVPAASGGASLQLSLYLVDFGNKGRVQQVDIVDPATGAVLSSQVVSNFSGGKYLTYTVTGAVEIRVSRLAGPSAVLNAIFTT